MDKDDILVKEYVNEYVKHVDKMYEIFLNDFQTLLELADSMTESERNLMMASISYVRDNGNILSERELIDYKCKVTASFCEKLPELIDKFGWEGLITDD